MISFHITLLTDNEVPLVLTDVLTSGDQDFVMSLSIM